MEAVHAGEAGAHGDKRPGHCVRSPPGAGAHRQPALHHRSRPGGRAGLPAAPPRSRRRRGATATGGGAVHGAPDERRGGEHSADRPSAGGGPPGRPV